MDDLAVIQKDKVGSSGKVGRRPLLIGWLAAFSAPLMLLAGSWFYVFPAQLEKGADLVWAVSLGIAAVAFLMGIYLVVRKRWLAGFVLILGTAVLLGLGILAYGISVLFYFGTDQSLSFLLAGMA